MSLLEIFRPDLRVERGLFFGLDTIITGGISNLLDWDGTFGMVKAPQMKGTCCNAVLSFSPPWARRLWHRWDTHRERWRGLCSRGLGMGKHPPSEVVYLRRHMNQTWTYLDDVFPGQIVSYKFGVRRDPETLKQARVVYFHGDPKPPNIPERELLEAWQ